MNKQKTNDFKTYLNEQLKTPKDRALFNKYGKQLEISYAMATLRKKQKLSQAQVAKKLGTTQSNVARMEAGRQNFSVSTLLKLAELFGKELTIKFS